MGKKIIILLKIQKGPEEEATSITVNMCFSCGYTRARKRGSMNKKEKSAKMYIMIWGFLGNLNLLISFLALVLWELHTPANPQNS